MGWTNGDIDAGLVADRQLGSTHGTQVTGIAAGNGRDSTGVSAYVGGAPDSSIVVVALGDAGGPHDGTAWLEQALACLIKSGRLIVKSAGNGGRGGGHAARDIASGATVDVSFDVPPGSPSLQCLQVWYAQRRPTRCPGGATWRVAD